MPSNKKFQSTSVYRTPNALRHGVYSMTAVLPGEDQAAFDKLHRDLIAEYSPDGASECDIVQTMAALTWRKQNLKTIRLAVLVQGRLSSVIDDMVAARFPGHAEIATHPKSQEIIELAKAKVCEELGDVYALLELGEAASFDSLSKVLDFEERLDGMIVRCLKRLLLARGVKSTSRVAPSQAALRIAAPPEAT